MQVDSHASATMVPSGRDDRVSSKRTMDSLRHAFPLGKKNEQRGKKQPWRLVKQLGPSNLLGIWQAWRPLLTSLRDPGMSLEAFKYVSSADMVLGSTSQRPSTSHHWHQSLAASVKYAITMAIRFTPVVATIQEFCRNHPQVR